MRPVVVVVVIVVVLLVVIFVVVVVVMAMPAHLLQDVVEFASRNETVLVGVDSEFRAEEEFGTAHHVQVLGDRA